MSQRPVQHNTVKKSYKMMHGCVYIRNIGFTGDDHGRPSSAMIGTITALSGQTRLLIDFLFILFINYIAQYVCETHFNHEIPSIMNHK